ncbi:Uu.00g006760.m01.CDS01 [Anthostomella pinea]|uniref:Uu.00g006760.m01.CDS01 n=1 Tax=Anthostomella pinea TaxID=933095 RepID=A0AAI8VKD9_9PEZI|nr:Uu.00g006760.m01.CDS01 [Anthostomella pinea]
MLRCLLRQLVEALPMIPTSIYYFYERLDANRGPLPQHECERFITELASDLDGCFLVFDALDEEIDQHGTLQSVGDDFAKRLLDTLPERADGMFLLAVLQLRTILREPTLGEMEDALESLSHDLTEAFKDTVLRIKTLPKSRCRLGMDALMWVSHAKRPLTLEELLDVLVVRPGLARVNAKYRPSLITVLDCCQGLLVMDQETRVIRPAHYAIQEYLHSSSTRKFPTALSQMACICPGYLSFNDFRDGPWDDKKDIDDHISSWRFLEYASLYWGKHVKAQDSNPQVMSSLDNFFSSSFAPSVAIQVVRRLAGYREVYWDPEECRSFTPLHHAARSGLASRVNSILSSGLYNVNICTKMGTTAIIQAAAEDHTSVVRTLLQHGADPLLENWYGNALHRAIGAGSLGAIHELLAWGMDLDDPRYIISTMDNDQADAFGALVDLGAREDSYLRGEDQEDRINLFHYAAAHGCGRIVEVIVRKGSWDLHSRDARGRTVMHYAATTLDPQAFKALVDAGGRVNLIDDFGKGPLDYAVEHYNEAWVGLLEDAAAVRFSTESPA